jgi:predicted CXXCH cytochrome family protein
MPDVPFPSAKFSTPRHGQVVLRVLIVLLAVGAVGALIWRARARPHTESTPEPTRPVAKNRYSGFGKFGFWFGEPTVSARRNSQPTGDYSNIEPEDYSKGGPAQCGSCHPTEFKAWSNHAHRWMNAKATPDHVKGDFREQVRFPYLGGQGRFWRQGDQSWMAAERGKVRRAFRITRTIGSRYFEYYVGVQTVGPEPAGDPRYQVEHVLPFGYWLAKRQWVPTVHIREDRADDHDEPNLNPYEDFYFRGYDEICARCHTTLPAGDSLIRSPDDAGKYSPYRFSMDLAGYLQRQRPDFLPAPIEQVETSELQRPIAELISGNPPARILHLGIVCEACHNGCRQHVADPEHTPPHFFPTSPAVYAELPHDNPHGRTRANVNWVCSRCHVGLRPEFPGGASTWNSAEYSDALRGGCYSQLRCVDCHEPHHTIGPAWAHTADHDDGLCLRCHKAYQEARARQAHTHHSAGSDGDRCMNCHMPRVNEGLDAVVRTHTIHSPTRPAVIEQNGPNACNLCHLDRSIDWTLQFFQKWYGRRFNEYEIAKNYANRQAPVGSLWLQHPFRATRLVTAAAYARRKKADILPELLGILDDPYLLNRQFGQMAVEELCGQSLAKWGYQFTLSPEERRTVLHQVQAVLARGKP